MCNTFSFVQLYSMYSSNFETAQMEYSKLLRKNKAFKELVQIIEVYNNIMKMFEVNIL